MFQRILVVLICSLLALPFTATDVSAQIACDTATSSKATPAATPEPVLDVTFPEEGGTLTVFAAASLTDAFGQMESSLEEAHPNLDIVIETAGSQTLVTQISQGAPADVLATADLATMQTATDDGLIAGDPAFFAGNRLVIVAPADNPAGIESIDDLMQDDLALVLTNRDVPAGAYGIAAFCSYASGDDAPEGFLDGISGNVVSEEQDVRTVLTKVLLGEADAGVVYVSDAEAAARSGQDLTVVEFPDGVAITAIYPIASVTGGNTELADAFIAYVMSDEGQRILDEYGFT